MTMQIHKNKTRAFIEKWNILYPIDRWWRQKHGIALNSSAHREQCMFSMRLEFEEDLMYNEFIASLQNNEVENYVPGRGEWLKKSDLPANTQQEIDDAFDKLDVSQIDI